MGNTVGFLVGPMDGERLGDNEGLIVGLVGTKDGSLDGAAVKK